MGGGWRVEPVIGEKNNFSIVRPAEMGNGGAVGAEGADEIETVLAPPQPHDPYSEVLLQQ